MESPTQSYTLPHENATISLGRAIAEALQVGDFIALYGDLGMGKTTLTRGLVQGAMRAPVEVVSPTFTLVQIYETETFPIWHYDLYRVEDPDEVLDLSWDETMDGVAIVEWPENAGPHLPSERLDVMLTVSGEGRIAVLTAHGQSWEQRLDVIGKHFAGS